MIKRSLLVATVALLAAGVLWVVGNEAEEDAAAAGQLRAFEAALHDMGTLELDGFGGVGGRRVLVSEGRKRAAVAREQLDRVPPEHEGRLLALTSRFERYRDAYDRELRLLADDRRSTARTYRLTTVQPQLDDLAVAVDRAVGLLERDAAAERRLLRVSAVAMVLVACAAVALLDVRSSRAAVRSAVADERGRALERSERHLRALLQGTGDGIVVLDRTTWAVRFATPRASSLLGLDAGALAEGAPLDVLPAPVAAALDELAVRCSRRRATTDVSVPAVEGRRTLQLVAVDLTAEPLVGGVLVTVRDVTLNRELQDTLAHRATHDALTGLPNREQLTAVLEGMVERRRGPCAFAFVDLDDFKHVNDTLGHHTGDLLLREVADRLRASVRDGDVVARLGGDEFALLLPGLATPREASEIVERVLASLHRPFRLAGATPSVTASVGLTFVGPGGDVQTALQEADIAMYAAKARGKARLGLFDARLQDELNRRVRLERDLRRAVTEEQFVLHYQPVVDLVTGTVHGVEALLRWRHPSGRLVPPATFVPLLEESGQIVEVGRWVLREACRDVADLRRLGHDLTVAVNVSAYQLNDELLGDVLTVLATTSLEPATLLVELTESAIIETPQARSLLLDLRNAGVGIALDDFGTGYSSLQSLASLPISQLKLDRSFTATVLDPHGHDLIEGLAHLAATVGISTVIEGVETPQEREVVAAMGYRRAQGELYSPPLPVSELLAFLDTRRPSR